MSENKAADWSALVKSADDHVSDLNRAISGVDRFNPMYFCVLALILLVLSGLTIAFATDVESSSATAIVKSLWLLLSSLLGLGSAALSFREALIYARRWKRAKAGLARSLREAEGLAAFGFVSTDKLDPQTDDEVKRMLLVLRDTIRDGRERLGMKD